MSFKPEVSTDGGRTFHQNNLAFATREEAETSAMSGCAPRLMAGSAGRTNLNLTPSQASRFAQCNGGSSTSL